MNMKKKTKISLIIIGAIVITIVISLNVNNHFSNRAINGKENLANSKSLRNGMSEDEIKKIMGEPDTVIKEASLIYCYDINDESFGYGQIFLDSSKRVKQIYFPQ